MESTIGLLLPDEGIPLYMALIDPHLTHGAEIIICLDITQSDLESLQEV
jgi:hypothetical protein